MFFHRTRQQRLKKRQWQYSCYLNLLLLPLLFCIGLGFKNIESHFPPTVNAQDTNTNFQHQNTPNRTTLTQGHITQAVVNPTVLPSQAVLPKTAFNNTPETEKIKVYIKSVFGPDYNKAIQLLTNPACHENGNLNPNAVNHNYGVSGVITSTDWGLFQINDHWQGFNQISDRFLLNYKINTNIAKEIFDENGHTFDRWTCGKALGI